MCMGHVNFKGLYVYIIKYELTVIIKISTMDVVNGNIYYSTTHDLCLRFD